ncbi:MAG: hypothetical protein ACYC28_02460 [Longimicrobiales bacterium]
MRYSALLIMCLASAAIGCGESADDTGDNITDDAVAAPAGELASPADETSAAPTADAADRGNGAAGDPSAPADRTDDGGAPTDDDADDGVDDSSDDDVAGIPARFHGEWNADPDACGTGSSESRLRISADRIRFYESVGVVEDVDIESDRVITVEARYQGEGDTWSDERRLSLSSDGSSLTVSGGGDMVRHRCP